jgi:hypothetical protein
LPVALSMHRLAHLAAQTTVGAGARRLWLVLALIAGLVGNTFGAAAAVAMPGSELKLAWLKLPGSVDQSAALQSWAQEVRLRTSVRIAAQPAGIRPEDTQLFSYPLLYWAGDRAVPRLPDVAVARLRAWLQAGGTLVIDNTGRTEASSAFDAGVRRELARILPQPLQRVAGNHVVFRAFYRLERALGRRADAGELEGIPLSGHMAVLYIRNDLGGALIRANFGGYSLPVVPGGEDQRERAFRFAVNLVLYALCLDYKDDHTHVMHLLRNRRGRPAVPAAGALPPAVPSAPSSPTP